MSRFRTELPWGVTDQIFSSAANVGLAIVSGRLLGPSGLGVVYVGMATYLVVQTLQRALVTDPLRVSMDGAEDDETRVAVRNGLSMTLVNGLAVTGLIAVAGLVVPGRFGHSLLLFVPWVVPSLVQDFWRWALFGAGRGSAATVNDAIRAFCMGGALVIAWHVPSDWALVGCWGIGAAAGAAFGFVQTRLPRGQLSRAWAWWRTEALPLGRWLGIESLVLSSGTVAVPFILAAVVGTADLGGLRAVDALFAPMTFLGQAIELPALPHLSRWWRSSPERVRAAAARVSVLAIALLGAYLLIVLPHRERLMAFVFGVEFLGFDRLILPVVIGEVIYAGGLGFFVLLKASGRGRARLVSESVADVSTIGLVWVLASIGGISAAAWGRTAGYASGQVTATMLVLTDKGVRTGRPRRTGPAARVFP